MSLSLTNICDGIQENLQLYADALVFWEGQEETMQEFRMGEDGIHFGAGKGKF